MKSPILQAILLCTCLTTANAQIIIAEIFRNPEEVVEQDGEWFEVYNTTGAGIDLQGWEIRDNGAEAHTIASSLVVPAGGFAVLCNNDNPVENGGANGGFVCDYEYSGIILFNTTDAIILLDASDTEVDRVEYDATWPPSFEGSSGVSMVFVGSPSDDNNDPSNWTIATLREPTYSAFVINCCDRGSPGTAGSLSNLLPVELTSFEAAIDDGDIILRWETSSETNNAGFSIEHQDGRGFREIGYAEGFGNTIQPQVYEYRVTGLFAGSHTFRLRQVDFDGSFSYSPEVEVTIQPTDSYELTEAYPNPFNPSTTFHLTLKRSQYVEVDIVDILGRSVRRLFQGDMPGGERRSFVVDASRLASGTYLYKVTGSDFTASRPILLLK